MDWSRSIRRRRNAVLKGQINKDVDLRPQATDGAFAADRQNQLQVDANQDDNHVKIELFSASLKETAKNSDETMFKKIDSV